MMQVEKIMIFYAQVFVGDTGENSFSDVETSKRLGKGSEKKWQSQIYFNWPGAS